MVLLYIYIVQQSQYIYYNNIQLLFCSTTLAAVLDQYVTAAAAVDRAVGYYPSSCDATTSVSTIDQQHYISPTTATAVTPDYRTNYVSICHCSVLIPC